MKTLSVNHKYFVVSFTIILIFLCMQGISFGQNLNVGVPRTVRMIYFLPNDLPYDADVVQKIKDDIRTVQTFYSEQMQAHGYGNKTFQFETDTRGNPKVHRVDGQHPFSYYDNTLGTFVINELKQTFDFKANIYVVVLGADFLNQGNGLPAGGVAHKHGKIGGDIVVPNRFGMSTVAHELGHTFGLDHDFRDNTYLMSYGNTKEVVLSTCAAGVLAVNPYFNPRIPIVEASPPTIELISSLTYPPGSKSITVRLKVKASAGIHQVQLQSWGGVQDYRGLAGEQETTVEFEYDGGIGLLDFDANIIGSKSLSDSLIQYIWVIAIDKEGNEVEALFKHTKESPHHIITLGEQTKRVVSLEFSPDGNTLASGSEGGLKLWDLTTDSEINPTSYNRDVKSVGFSPDGTILAFGGYNSLKLWDLITGNEIDTLSDTIFTTSVSFSPDGTTLAVGDWHGEVKFWDVATRHNIFTQLVEEKVKTMSFSPDWTTFAYIRWQPISGYWRGEVKLLHTDTGSEITTFVTDSAAQESLSFSPDGTILALGAWNNVVKLWDLSTYTEIATLQHTNGVMDVGFSADGSILASGDWNGIVKLWDIGTYTEIGKVQHTSGVTAVAISPDGTTLATGTHDGSVNLWSVESILSQPTIDYSDNITISEIMVAANDGNLPQWIELNNRSSSNEIDLNGWTLEIQNLRSDDFNGDSKVLFTFKDKLIMPQNTLLIVSKQGRSSKHFPDEKVYNLNTLHPQLQDILFNEKGFYMKLSNAAGKLIDEVGNLNVKQNMYDKPIWSLPKIVTKDDRRTSFIRRQENGTSLLGTEASGWISAVNTGLSNRFTSYYGHPNDIGAPGIISGGALPVQLSHFQAEHADAGVLLNWTTESEVDNAGFYIYRSATKDGEYAVVNSIMIQGAGTTGERNEYSWTDTSAKPNTVYYYRIEDVSHAGEREQLATVRLRGLLSAKGKLTTLWADLKK